MSVEIIKCLKKILKGVSTLQNTAFNHHTRHQKGGGDDLESLLRLAELAEKSHGSLTGVTASQHHAKTTSGEIDHGSVQGLGDDDHGQYYNASRHTKVVHDALGIDHGSLSGRGDDDHTQYLHLNKVNQTLLQNLLVASGKTVDGVDVSKLPENIHQVVSSGGSTTSTSYVDLVSLGSKTFYGNKVLIMWSCNARNSLTPNGVQVGLFIDDVEDEDFRGKDHSVANNFYFIIGKQKIRTLSAGPHTIKLKYYAADAGTAETAHVMLIAIEFGS